MSPDDPRHGTIAGYTRGCRQACCKRARRLHETQRRRDIDRGITYTVPSLGTIRRTQALMRLGWTSQHIADLCGLQNGQAILLLAKRPKVRRDTAQNVARVYEQLSMSLGPSDTTRRRAQAKRWPPPLAWDDIDDPNEKPTGIRDTSRGRPRDDVDEAVVIRALSGERLPMTRAEREEIRRRWVAAGGSGYDLDVRMGWRSNRYGASEES